MSDLITILFGFLLLLCGMISGFTATYQMIGVLNRERPFEAQIPRWHAFIRFLSNDVINKYRASHFGGLPNTLIKACWILMGVGFVVVLGSHFIAK